MAPDFPLEVIPVLDLKQGLVVRGVGGRREAYCPIESQLVRDAHPASLAAALARCGFKRLYVADLDAIAGAEPAWDIYHALREHGAELWIDAGVGDVDRARKLVELAADGPPPCVVVGLESLPSMQRLAEICQRIDVERIVFSLDLFEGRPLCRWDSRRDGDVRPEPAPLAIMEQAIQAGVRRAIVLDLARVGCFAGAGHLELLRTIRERWPRVRLISGGGVRSRDDLSSLADAGCEAALVASALHNGRLLAPAATRTPPSSTKGNQ